MFEQACKMERMGEPVSNDAKVLSATGIECQFQHGTRTIDGSKGGHLGHVNLNDQKMQVWQETQPCLQVSL